ncbi:hypothetical protein [Modestobacter sp. NPDC049651]|uniref:hypothetical protein n=1 Tax=unclassified Modestobacter TaxID=2643866 RepID=UPI0033FA2DAA
MRKWVAISWAVWAVASVLAFVKDPILGVCVLVFLGAVAVVLTMASGWDEHPDYETREQLRAERRAAKWERTKGSREKDAARYAAAKAKQAEKQARRAS